MSEETICPDCGKPLSDDWCGIAACFCRWGGRCPSVSGIINGAEREESELLWSAISSRQDAQGSVFTPETTMDSVISDQERKLAGEALWDEFEAKDRIKTREINTLTAENRKLLDALRRSKAELEGWSRSSTHAGKAYAIIAEALK